MKVMKEKSDFNEVIYAFLSEFIKKKVIFKNHGNYSDKSFCWIGINKYTFLWMPEPGKKHDR
jgi:hypothetical protein